MMGDRAAYETQALVTWYRICFLESKEKNFIL